LAPITSLLLHRALGVRVNQAWKPLRETPSVSQSHDAGHIARCFATNRTSYRVPREIGRGFFRMSRSAFSFTISRRNRLNLELPAELASFHLRPPVPKTP
jgi:hypothetical protein